MIPRTNAGTAKAIQVEIANLEHLTEFLVGNDAVDGSFCLFSGNLKLSGNAGADVDDWGVVGGATLDEAADGYHGRNNAY